MSSLVETAETSTVERLGFVDVHAHLIHEKFEGHEDAITNQCRLAGLDYVVVNGLEPVSNRAVLDLCNRNSDCLLPALGIYPLEAACQVITPETWNHPFPPPQPFDLDAEIEFIENCAIEKKIVAIGECGLDAFYLTDTVSLQAQEEVLRKLLKVAKRHDLPVILHSRKAEKRVFELLQEENIVKADFHCYCGKLNLAKQIVQAGYFISIPSAIASANPTSSFHQLVKQLPIEQLLTETDSPYMGPVKGESNTPVTVRQSIQCFAEIKGIEESEMRNIIRSNFQRLFGL
jgi:TatD DNase family protein